MKNIKNTDIFLISETTGLWSLSKALSSEESGRPSGRSKMGVNTQCTVGMYTQCTAAWVWLRFGLALSTGELLTRWVYMKQQ